jgi:hypothetical protein
MKKLRLPYLFAVLTLAGAGRGQHIEPTASGDYSYSAALISTISSRLGHIELVVFPLQGPAFRIPIRSAGVPLTFSPKGEALYGPCTPDARDRMSLNEHTKVAWCKIDLETGNTTVVQATVQDLSRDVYRVPSTGLTRLFGLTLPEGELTAISLPADGHPWMDLSLSPDKERAVVSHNGRVELIDIVRGTFEPLSGEFFMAAWSPDGKWLAAVEKGERGRTILMDSNGLVRRRILGPSELAWSPDSHYLLGMKQHDRCGPYSGSLETINIETCARASIKSSECQVNQATAGWVRSGISAREGAQGSPDNKEPRR